VKSVYYDYEGPFKVNVKKIKEMKIDGAIESKYTKLILP
jgi:hypothetical protein